MVMRSLTASQQGVHLAENALITQQLKQTDLAKQVECDRQTVSKFFNRKPVDRQIFVTICTKLKLNWQDIVNTLDNKLNQTNNTDVETLIQAVREKIRSDVRQRCGKMQVLDMTQPIGLGDIYTDVNILENITGRRRLALAELQEIYKLSVEEFDRLG